MVVKKVCKLTLKKELTGEPEPIYDTDDFWKELDHYRLINELQKK